MKERLMVCLLWRFGTTSSRNVHYLYVWIFTTIYGNNYWYCYHGTSFASLINRILTRFVKRVKCASSTSVPYSNVWRLLDSEFWILYLFIKKSIVIPRGRSGMGCYLFYWERFSSISWFSGQFVHCRSPWSLFVQYIEHLCACYAKSPMITKAKFVLPECWPQFKPISNDLKS